MTNSDPSRAVVARVSRRILPLLFIGYLLAQFDRLNVAFAQFGMRTDIGLNDESYGASVAFFFASYVLLEVPANLVVRRIGARAAFAIMISGWGAVTIATSQVHTVGQFYVARLALGVFEAGFFPAIVLYIGYWYPVRLHGVVLAAFAAAIPISGILVGPASAYILSAWSGIGSLAGWQWLFILEGIPAVVFGLVVAALLPSSPADARWLSDDEKSLLPRLWERVAQGPPVFSSVARDPATYLLALTFFAVVGALYSLNFWLPLLIKERVGGSQTEIGFLSALPYVTAIFLMVAWGRHSDRTQDRTWHFAAAAAAAAAAAFLACTPLLPRVATLACLCLACAAILACIPIFWAIAQNHYAPSAAPTGIALVNSLGVLAGAIVPYAIGWSRTHLSNPNWPLWAVGGLSAAAAAVLVASARRIGIKSSEGAVSLTATCL